MMCTTWKMRYMVLLLGHNQDSFMWYSCMLTKGGGLYTDKGGDEVKEKVKVGITSLGPLTGVMMSVFAMLTQRVLRGTITR